MSEVVASAVLALKRKLDGSGFDGVALFVIEGEGAVLIDGTDVSAAEPGTEADVTLTADAGTFEEMLGGETDPTAAFMSGRLKIDGDMGAAMRLGQTLA